MITSSTRHPGASWRRVIMEILGFVMLTAISLYMFVQVADLTR
jgi:hypothetical protein